MTMLMTSAALGPASNIMMSSIAAADRLIGEDVLGPIKDRGRQIMSFGQTR